MENIFNFVFNSIRELLLKMAPHVSDKLTINVRDINLTKVISSITPLDVYLSTQATIDIMDVRNSKM